MSVSDVDEVVGPFLLPEKSKKRYELSYKLFKDWCISKNNAAVTESLLLKYFLEKSTTLKSPASLWCEYSMLKTTILINENVDISKYVKLREFLKKKNDGYKPKKSNIFTREEINQFLEEAPDKTYLLIKVVMIIGIAGACRCNELCEMKVENVKEENGVINITIPDLTNGVPRIFTIASDNSENNVSYVEIVKKYINIRAKTKNSRFFVRYQGGKCYNQPVGKNTFSEMPSKIAKFLNLENPETYTGHSFRKTSGNLLTNTGLLTLRKHREWVFSNIAASNLADTLKKKNDVTNEILHNKNDTHDASSNTIKETEFPKVNELSNSDNKNIKITMKGNNNSKPIFVNNISNCNNCNITINIKY